MRRLVISLIALLGLSLVECACAGRPKTLPALNLTARQHQINEQRSRIQLAITIMDEDLNQLIQLHAAFFEQPITDYAPPFPIDLFKQTAMSCLNEPRDTPTAAAALSQEQDEFIKALLQPYQPAIACAPSSLFELLSTLQRVSPAKLDAAISQLQRVDQLRQLNSKLQQRSAKLPTLMRQQRLELDRQRLELQRIRAQLNRRQDEYKLTDYKRSIEQLNQLNRQLNALELNLTLMSDKHQRWAPDATARFSQFTFDLAGLYYSRFDDAPLP